MIWVDSREQTREVAHILAWLVVTFMMLHRSCAGHRNRVMQEYQLVVLVCVTQATLPVSCTVYVCECSMSQVWLDVQDCRNCQEDIVVYTVVLGEHPPNAAACILCLRCHK